MSIRPKTFLPLNITPRTRRISKEFGLTDEKILKFNNNNLGDSSSRYKDENTIGLLRRSASSLFEKSPIVHLSSVTENLSKRKECISILDSPGVSKDQNSYPISWSRHNLIAVICAFDIFYQNVDTKSVSQLCRSVHGNMNVIQWAGEEQPNYLAAGNHRGMVLIWDVASGGGRSPLRSWQGTHFDSVKCLSWNQNTLAAGADSGDLSIIDIRIPDAVSVFKVHNHALTGAKWSPDGTLLATGDANGTTYIWDQRAGKSILNSEATTKIRHKGKVKAISWCPWQHDLLATGTTAPEGKIRIWNTSSISSTPTPAQTIPLNTSVTSLHWSPHCKELLSTHGSSFTPVLQSSIQNRGTSLRPRYAKSPLMNSIAVHQYPSCKRLMTLTNAHTGSITHSCLGPTGENLFTVCPNEETIKMWKVWTASKPSGKRESAFDKYTIR